MAIVRRCIDGGRCWVCSGGAFELLEKAVEIFSIEDQTGALRHGDQMRPPTRIEGPALDTDVVDGFEISEAAFHGVTL